MRKGAGDAVVRVGAGAGRRRCRPTLRAAVERIARDGRHAAGGGRARRTARRGCSASFYLKDIVKGGMRERFDRLRAMGIRTVMITGDNPLTAAAIAPEAGVDDFLAEAKPEDKMALIRQRAGRRHGSSR